MLREMYEMNLPVPKPVAALIKKSSFMTAKNAILTERIPDVENGFDYLKTNIWQDDQWRLLGQMIKTFHNHDVYHSDMNIHNILIDSTGKFWLIDFDKCAFRSGATGWKDETLIRLKRSLTKELTKFENFSFTESNWQTLMSGYSS